MLEVLLWSEGKSREDQDEKQALGHQAEQSARWHVCVSPFCSALPFTGSFLLTTVFKSFSLQRRPGWSLSQTHVAMRYS